jgi:hypothetical protein
LKETLKLSWGWIAVKDDENKLIGLSISNKGVLSFFNGNNERNG